MKISSLVTTAFAAVVLLVMAAGPAAAQPAAPAAQPLPVAAHLPGQGATPDRSWLCVLWPTAGFCGPNR